MQTQLEPSLTLAELASTIPEASRVFQRHRLDFCCHGDRPLADACSDAELDPSAVLAEIRAAVERASEPAERWDLRPLDELVQHILDRYHVPLYPELDRIVALVDKVVEVHGDANGDRLRPLASAVHGLADELRVHMSKEENILFPWLRSGQGRTAQGPIRVMQLEHDAAGEALEQIRGLTDEFTPPAEACVTWVALYVRLEDLDLDLREHIHLENNVLFPRALVE